MKFKRINENLDIMNALDVPKRGTPNNKQNFIILIIIITALIAHTVING